MGAIKILARAIGTKEKFFGVSGNKDKRAVTTQRVSTFANHWNALARVELGENLRIGNLEYCDEEVKMGSHSGNQFVITLRGVQQEVTDSLISSRIDQLRALGFINYFGLQRFGSATDTGTHRIGLCMLKQDYEQAVKLILGLRDDRHTEEAEARGRYLATGDVQQALIDFRGHVRSR
jgi:tRNA pseudouridine13 synthase